MALNNGIVPQYFDNIGAENVYKKYLELNSAESVAKFYTERGFYIHSNTIRNYLLRKGYKMNQLGGDRKSVKFRKNTIKLL